MAQRLPDRRKQRNQVQKLKREWLNEKAFREQVNQKVSWKWEFQKIMANVKETVGYLSFLICN